jgi:hypothetical protein
MDRYNKALTTSKKYLSQYLWIGVFLTIIAVFWYYRLQINKKQGTTNEDTIEEKKEIVDPLRFAQEKFSEKQIFPSKKTKKQRIIEQIFNLPIPRKYKLLTIDLIEGKLKQKDIPASFLTNITKYEEQIKKNLPKEIRDLFLGLAKKGFDYESFWKELEENEKNEFGRKKDILIKQFIIAARKDKLDENIVENILDLIEMEKPSKKRIKTKTLDWIQELFQDPVKKHWKDDIVLWLKKLNNI